jgi:hypothetical protein
MQRKLSIPVEFVHATLANTARAGIDANQLLITNRISPRLLLETNARISMERFADLQAHTMVAMNDESLGYHLQAAPARHLGNDVSRYFVGEYLTASLAAILPFLSAFRPQASDRHPQ